MSAVAGNEGEGPVPPASAADRAPLRPEEFATILAESERDRMLLAAIVESSDDAIVSKTLEGTVSSWNSGAERLFGYTAAEIVGRPITTIIPPELLHEEPAILAKIRQGERVDHFETRRRAKDGRLVDVSITVSPVRDGTGRIVGVSKVARDISERKRVEERFREADRRKDEFLAILGHELRNPLAPVRNVAAALHRMSGGDPLQEQLCHTLDRQVQHMTRLLDDLLDLSRITQGKIRLRNEEVDIRQVISRAVETSRSAIDARHQVLEIAVPDRPLRVHGDLDRLVQALGNLLNNATKYTHERGTISVTAAASGSHLELQVRDTGVGIAPELLPRLFEPFVQAERTLDVSQGGLGIGLTLVRGIMEQHGGHVEAFSAGPGLGSRFVMHMSLLAPSAGGAGTRESGCSQRSAAVGCKRVLIVDDNRDAGETLALVLRMSGHQVVVVPEAFSAIVAVRSAAPDLVLLDIGLPGMNGYELARRLRQDGFAATLAAVTGYGQAEDRRRSHDAGIDHHLVKPVDLAAIHRLLS